ncbi:MAG TPA: hypothetical protein VE687_09180 [Stellaceae bacterium]|nr:hypothetical protein [Stellaceae bacterium]
MNEQPTAFPKTEVRRMRTYTAVVCAALKASAFACRILVRPDQSPAEAA